MEIGSWIAGSSLLLSAALAFNGFRNTRVQMFRNRVEMLERQIQQLEEAHRRCEDQLSKLRSDNDWLMERMRAQAPSQRPRLPR